MKDLRHVILSAGTLALLACGSGEDLAGPTQVQCGPGTHLDKNKCVVDDAGSGGADGGTAGADGGQPESVVEAGVDTGSAGNGGTAGVGGAGGMPEDAGPDGPGPEDDPCPAEALSLDCSGQCGELSPDCELGTCRVGRPEIKVFDKTMLPFTFRTPSKPGVDPACQESCSEPTATVYGLGAMFVLDNGIGMGFRAQVGLPWRIISTDYMHAQYCTPTGSECVVEHYGNDMSFQIVTDDPNAPARNVTIERIDEPVSCPQ